MPCTGGCSALHVCLAAAVTQSPHCFFYGPSWSLCSSSSSALHGLACCALLSRSMRPRPLRIKRSCALQPRISARATSDGRRGVPGSPLLAGPARPGPPLICHRPRVGSACGHAAGSGTGNPADRVPDPAGRAEPRTQPAVGGAAAVAAAANAHPAAQRAARASRGWAACCGAHLFHMSAICGHAS